MLKPNLDIDVCFLLGRISCDEFLLWWKYSGKSSKLYEPLSAHISSVMGLQTLFDEIDLDGGGIIFSPL